MPQPLRLTLIFFAAALACIAAQAQSSPCDLAAAHESHPLDYPPIARAAHVSGDVTLMVRFSTTGKTEEVRILNGPPMLQGAARDYLSGLQVPPAPGSRQCPFEISFRVRETPPPTSCAHVSPTGTKITKPDPQHVLIETDETWTCDPSATISARCRKLLWFIFDCKALPQSAAPGTRNP